MKQKIVLSNRSDANKSNVPTISIPQAVQPVQLQVAVQPVQHQVAVQPVQHQVPVQPVQHQVPVQPVQHQVPVQPVHQVPVQPVQLQAPVTVSEQTGGQGTYTISYQDPSYITGTNAQIQFPNAPAPGQVVRVVAGNSQNDKQIYVIKLGNIIPNAEDENATVKVEVGDMNTPNEASRQQMVTVTETVPDQNLGQVIQPPNVGAGGVGGNDAVLNNARSGDKDKEEEEMDEEEMDENTPNPFNVISPESVMAMTESVGVELAEEDASTLGCFVTNVLRNVILNAMQFSQKQNSEGMTVEHFRKAEELLHFKNYGHESVFKEIPYKYAAGVSVIDDGPEINLYPAVMQTNLVDLETNEMEEPTLFVHHLRVIDEKSEPDEFFSTDLSEEPVVVYCEHERMLAAENEQENPTKSTSEKTPNPTPAKSPPVLPETVSNTNTPSTTTEAPPKEGDGDKSPDPDAEASGEVMVVEHMVHEFLAEVEENSHRRPEMNFGEELHGINTEENLENIAPEWSPYLQLLIEHVISYSYEEDFDCHVSSALHHYIVDIRRNGAHPILSIVCSNFLDNLRNARVSKSCVFNMVTVMGAFVNSDCQPTQVQMTQLAAVLIEIIILPPPCEIHQLLTNVFMKILKNCNELLTWTCTYVTEMLKMLSESPIEDERESLKASLHGCLCLANGLEDLNIQVAQEFGWHTFVLNLSKTHSAMFDGKLLKGSTQDSFLEQEILKFFKNFLNNYTSLVSPSELTKFREIVTTMYGERYASFVPSNNVVPVKGIPNSNVKPFKRARCVFRKVTYKDKEVLIPCRRYVKMT